MDDGVHPHTRGEDAYVTKVQEGGGGSPPHAWGRRMLVDALDDRARFTPTRVGKTWAAAHGWQVI